MRRVHPLILIWSVLFIAAAGMAGTGYMTGAGAEVFTTPDAAPLRLTDDIDLRVLVKPAKWVAGKGWPLIYKWDNSANGYYAYSFMVYDDGKPRLQLSTDGTTILAYAATASISVADGVQSWIRATRNKSGGSIDFYKSSDGTTWTSIGATVAATTLSLNAGTAIVRLGYERLGGGFLIGNLYKAEIRNGINGTLVANADFSNLAAGTQSFVDSTGCTWTSTYRGAVMVEPTAGDGSIFRGSVIRP